MNQLDPKMIDPKDCPEPFWHKTHRYCPKCSWTEGPEVSELTQETAAQTESLVRDAFERRAPKRFGSTEKGVLLEFAYTNWRDEEHVYLVEPEPVLEFGPYTGSGKDTSPEPECHWVLHGKVVSRDGILHGKRRTFLLSGITKLRERHDW